MKRQCLLGSFLLMGCGLFAIAQPEAKVPPAFEKTEGTVGSHDDAPNAATSEQAPDPFDPDADAPKLIQVQVDYVELSHQALTKLLFLAEPTESDAKALRVQLQELVAKNEATVLETQMLVAKSGQKATTESIHETIYPTEYEEPSRPGDKPKEPFAGGSFPYNPATPTAFDTRNVGGTLEVEPTLSNDNRIIDLRFIPELLWHTGNTTWQENKDAHGNISRVQMPDFYSLRLNTSVTCVAGQYMLAGVLSPKDAQGATDMTRKVMVFVKCSVLTVK